MNKEQAIKILKLDKNYTKEQLKKQYRLLALKIHPDKNKSDNANEEFRELNEAFIYLSDEKIEKNETYNSVIKNFILLLIDSPFSLKLLSDLDLEILQLINKCLNLYYVKIVNENNKVIIDRIQSEIMQILNEKNKEIIVLEPCIDDLFEQKVFKLQYNNEEFYVPLWHNEMIYKDISNNTFKVKCETKLPEHIDIDEFNNIHCYLKYNIKKLLIDNELIINIGKKTLFVKPENLHVKQNQIYIISNEGIPKINFNSFSEIKEISDIYLHICLY